MRGRDFFDDYKEFVEDVKKSVTKLESKIIEQAAEEIGPEETEEVDAPDTEEITEETKTEEVTEDVETE